MGDHSVIGILCTAIADVGAGICLDFISIREYKELLPFTHALRMTPEHRSGG